MGQIVGGAAKPKRCNLNKLSQLGTPAAGEHILVSSDNSMNAAGQGNFDCYIVGDGKKAATALELKSIADGEFDIDSSNSITNYAVTAALTYCFGSETNSTYLASNRVVTAYPIVKGVKKYYLTVSTATISASNYLQIRLVDSDNVGYFTNSGHMVRKVADVTTRDAVSYEIELTDAEMASAKTIMIGTFKADANHTPCEFTTALYNNTDGVIVKLLRGVVEKFPIKTDDLDNTTIEYLTDMRLYDETTNTYETDNRVKVNIPVANYKKYHLSLRELVGVSNGNPIVVRLYNTTNIGYWGSPYIVRGITTNYDNADYDVDIELTDKEFAQVKGIGIGMRDAKANHPEFSFRAVLYTIEGGARQQVMENKTHSDENEKKIGDLSVLETEDKTSIVGAVNEIMENGIAPHDDIPYNDTIYLASKEAFIRLYNPYKDKGSNVYMGQLHSHKQTMSYANFFAAHKNNGYSFIASIDYDRVRITENNPVAADIPSDFLYLCNGYEANCGAGAGQNGEHMIILNAKSVVGFDELTKMSFPSPKSIADVKSKFVDAGCVVQLAHPYWSTLFQTPEKIATLKSDLRFVEIYSGLNEHNANTEAGYAWDYALDILLSQGNFTFGTAVSDVHAEETSVSSTIIKMGAVKVFANSLTNADVFNALLNGCYYSVSHTTKAISDVSFTDAGVFNVQVGESNALVEFIGKDAEVLATHTTSSTTDTASYQITGNEMYVRARVTYSDGKLAWTQAIFFDKRIL